MLGLTSFLAIWACKKDIIDVQPELLTPTKNLKASERSLTDPSCCEFTNLFCTSALKPPCKTIYTGNGGDNVFVVNGLVVKGTTYQLTPLFNDGIAADFELTTGTGTNVLTNIPKQILVDGEININQPVEKEFAILYDIADLLQQGASIEAIQVRIGNKGSIETLSNGQKQLVVNSAAFENRDVSNLTVVSNSVDCLVAKQRVAERFSDLTGIPIEICQNIVTRDPNFSCSGCNDPMRLFNHFLTTLDVKDGKNWEIIKLSDQARTTYRNAIYKAFLENGVKMSSSDASAFIASNNTLMQDLLKTTPTNSDWCGAYEKGKKTVRIKVLTDRLAQNLGLNNTQKACLLTLSEDALKEMSDLEQNNSLIDACNPNTTTKDMIKKVIDDPSFCGTNLNYFYDILGKDYNYVVLKDLESCPRLKCLFGKLQQLGLCSEIMKGFEEVGSNKFKLHIIFDKDGKFTAHNYTQTGGWSGKQSDYAETFYNPGSIPPRVEININKNFCNLSSLEMGNYLIHEMLHAEFSRWIYLAKNNYVKEDFSANSSIWKEIVIKKYGSDAPANQHKLMLNFVDRIAEDLWKLNGETDKSRIEYYKYFAYDLLHTDAGLVSQGFITQQELDRLKQLNATITSKINCK